MRKTVLYDTDQFKLISHGGGLGVEFIHKTGLQFIFLQGEDGYSFLDDLAALENLNPHATVNAILWRAWFDFSDLAEPIDTTEPEDWPLIVSKRELVQHW